MNNREIWLSSPWLTVEAIIQLWAPEAQDEADVVMHHLLSSIDVGIFDSDIDVKRGQWANHQSLIYINKLFEYTNNHPMPTSFVKFVHEWVDTYADP